MYYTAWCATRCQAIRGAGLAHVRHLQKLQHDQLLFRALAAVAVTGAAFAQVTISGSVSQGMQSIGTGVVGAEAVIVGTRMVHEWVTG